jgi:hypothetical protein
MHVKNHKKNNLLIKFLVGPAVLSFLLPLLGHTSYGQLAEHQGTTFSAMPSLLVKPIQAPPPAPLITFFFMAIQGISLCYHLRRTEHKCRGYMTNVRDRATTPWQKFALDYILGSFDPKDINITSSDCDIIKRFTSVGKQRSLRDGLQELYHIYTVGSVVEPVYIRHYRDASKGRRYMLLVYLGGIFLTNAVLMAVHYYSGYPTTLCLYGQQAGVHALSASLSPLMPTQIAEGLWEIITDLWYHLDYMILTIFFNDEGESSQPVVSFVAQCFGIIAGYAQHSQLLKVHLKDYKRWIDFLIRFPLKHGLYIVGLPWLIKWLRAEGN